MIGAIIFFVLLFQLFAPHGHQQAPKVQHHSKPHAAAVVAKPAPAPAPVVAPPAPKPTPKPVPAFVPVNTYPANLANAPMDTIGDPAYMYNRECVSYTAWKVQEAYGSMPDFHPDDRGLDAKQWPARAAQLGIPTGSVPKVHSVAIAAWVGTHGHAAWVERVNLDGTIVISQYNAGGDGTFSYQTVSGSGLTYIYFGG